MDQGSHYLLALKGNRGALHVKVQDYFEPRIGPGLSGGNFGKTRVDFAVQAERGHGRIEVRQAWAVAARVVPAIVAHFPGVKSLLCMERSRTIGPEMSVERVYFLSSKPPKAKLLMQLVRDHWSVENHLHRSLDVVLHEDAARIRKGPAAENMAVLRRWVLTLLKRDTTYPKRSLIGRMRTAQRLSDYRLKLLTLGGDSQID